MKTSCRDVFNHVDAIVVPSVWVENSPLVIWRSDASSRAGHHGGLWRHGRIDPDGENGLLFKFRDAQSLPSGCSGWRCTQSEATRLGERGYLNNPRR